MQQRWLKMTRISHGLACITLAAPCLRYPPPLASGLSLIRSLSSCASESVTIPSSTINYKRLAESLSQWVATYVWKLCTTGMSLPSEFAVPMYAFSLKQPRIESQLTSHYRNGASTPYANTPPSHLAGSIHSLFLSTLLQPSDSGTSHAYQ